MYGEKYEKSARHQFLLSYEFFWKDNCLHPDD
jgi:hypothetical protein